jgi:hypothetical protein
MRGFGGDDGMILNGVVYLVALTMRPVLDACAGNGDLSVPIVPCCRQM